MSMFADDPYDYELEIRQHPIRARMCGLGDKDRRQISPPVCVKLNIYYKGTKNHIAIDELTNRNFFLVSQLWSADMKTDLSTVISDTPPIKTPSINTSSTSMSTSMSTSTSTSTPTSSNLNVILESNTNTNTNPKFNFISNKNKNPISEMKYNKKTHQLEVDKDCLNRVPPTEMSIPVKNLIGNLTSVLTVLKDDRGETGFWFVLSDLSVRVEGVFRLKCSLFNPMRFVINNNSDCITNVFSNEFKVYSAKKFPGVLESTPLSRAFAGQSVQIHIRKDQKS
ncbi:velvet factor family protein ASCRUDRAFT_71456 [Ascoidea rubescens DSM 1968]|uniref:Velvet domain-containing protein n=1 Tax=Ascoidea rubescens DSM 1968 TaxID=1344418 RepID=A0A1D2VED9_9ASCO|nr:hypothetical protein ASCRUDRAFT_71456 [Ascoidea rubescens DSM 1968]ODV59985.1 hypothetical protein ASCRUDRAFT_71456 [Ascoidea rubescens DSM 1968]